MGRKKKTELSIEKVYKYDISKSNTFVMTAAFDYSLIETKLFNYILTKVHPDDEKKNNVEEELDPLSYIVDFDEFCKMAGMKICGVSYQYIKTGLENLMKKIINMKIDIGTSDSGTTGIHFLDRYLYFDKKGYAIVRIDDRMIPFVIKMNSNFLKYNPRYTMLADSKYTDRIYNYLKASMDKRQSGIKKGVMGTFKKDDFIRMSKEEKDKYVEEYKKMREQTYEISVDIQEFKYILNISPNIKGYKMLESKVLDKSRKEINAFSNIFIEDISYSDQTNKITFKVRYKEATEICKVNMNISEKINNTYLL